ncbi:unnamed protein product [Amoebophrya sp. A25]|nr:unnamed protein product [Amoebophrya sp. A25]|eukprot:GSA25T00008371001.1
MFNANWGDKVLMCFPRFVRYPPIQDEQLLRDAERMNKDPNNETLRQSVVEQVRAKLENKHTDPRTREVLSQTLSGATVSTELQVKNMEVDPSGLPFPSMMNCVVMDPVKKGGDSALSQFL